ncbi:MAG: cytochrome c [Alphaproteobacteria bacterium]|nr:cytochrome c [Alphaproteobacteria bacterium]
MEERNRTRLTWSLGALIAAGVLAGVVGLVEVAGGFDTAATHPFPQPATWLVHRTMIDSVKWRAQSVSPPPKFTEPQVMAGFRDYDADCAMCHGAPGVGRQPWVAGMDPPPPYLLDAANRWRPEELYFIVSEGVKMTGMPAWRKALPKDEIWNIVAFLEAMPRTTAADYARLRATYGPGAPIFTQPPKGPPAFSPAGSELNQGAVPGVAAQTAPPARSRPAPGAP